MGPLAWIVAGSALGGVVGLGVAAIAWRHREEPGATSFGWLMVAVGGWGLSQAGLLTSRDVGVAYALEMLTSTAATQVPPLFLTFVFAYTGRQRWLRPRYLAVVWAIPAAFAVASLTGPLHGLTGTPGDVTMVTAGGMTAPFVSSGLFGTVALRYGYLLTAVAFALLLWFVITARAAHRRQAMAITVAAAIGVTADVATHAGLTLHPTVGLAPVSITMSGVIIGWALFRQDFLQVSPLAGDLLVDELPDPVFVIDEDGVVVDHNAAAAETFGSELKGDPIAEHAEGVFDALGGSMTYSLTGDDGLAYFDPQVTPIHDQHGDRRGRLVVLRNVTGQQRRQDRLEALQAATQEFITAETEERIAELTVTFADRVLDQDGAAVYAAGDDAFRPVAVRRGSERTTNPEDLAIYDPSHPVWRAYEEETTMSGPTGDEDATPFRQLLAVPLDGYGVLAIGREAGGEATDVEAGGWWDPSAGAGSATGDQRWNSDPGVRPPETRREAGFADEDEQFAQILAKTTQVALTQIERERELRESRASVERRTEQIEFFNGVLRHNLRNALLVIEGRAEYLRGQVGADDEHHVDRIVEWCDGLADLTESIRSINDTVTATEAERLDVVDLSSVLRDCVERFAADNEAAAVDCEIETDLRVMANTLVNEVIDSVLHNAVRHNDRDDPRVEIRTRRTGDQVQIRIADNGPGMSDDLKESVFERDVTTSHTAHGFGLYFVSVMMNHYDGTVWFEDNEPRGAVAVLEFRAAEDGAEAKGTSPAA